MEARCSLSAAAARANVTSKNSSSAGTLRAFVDVQRLRRPSCCYCLRQRCDHPAASVRVGSQTATTPARGGVAVRLCDSSGGWTATHKQPLLFFARPFGACGLRPRCLYSPRRAQPGDCISTVALLRRQLEVTTAVAPFVHGQPAGYNWGDADGVCVGPPQNIPS